MTLGQKIRKARIRNGMTVQDLAEATGLTVRTINNVESGTTAHESTLIRICEAVGANYGRLMEGEKVVNASINLWREDLSYPPVHTDDSGWLIRAASPAYIPRYGFCEVQTGLDIQLPDGFIGYLVDDGSLGLPDGVLCEGVIKSVERSTVTVKLFNLSGTAYMLEAGDRIAKLFIVPEYVVGMKINRKEIEGDA